MIVLRSEKSIWLPIGYLFTIGNSTDEAKYTGTSGTRLPHRCLFYIL